MIQKLDEYIDRVYTKNLWFIKYRGEIVYNLKGVRGYKTKGAAKSKFTNSIVESIKSIVDFKYYIPMEKCAIIAKSLKVPVKDLESLCVKYTWDECKLLSYLDLEHYIKVNILPKWEDSKLVEFIKL